MKVLIVDSHFTEIPSLRAHLEKKNFKIFAATNFANACDVINQDKPDMVLIVLSSVDSLNLLTKIREEYSSHELPVIMLGNNDEEKNLIASLNMGSNDYVVKSLTPQNILEKIEAVATA